jgi:hypothetical protein
MNSDGLPSETDSNAHDFVLTVSKDSGGACSAGVDEFSSAMLHNDTQHMEVVAWKKQMKLKSNPATS